MNLVFPIIILMLVAGCASNSTSNPADGDTRHVDVDLTILSETIISAELMHIILNSDDYIGKTIKVGGTYANIFHEATGMHYHYVITKQGDACCQEGIEFILTDDRKFPDDYPAMGTPIELIGVFSRGEGDGIRFFYLATDDIHILG